MSAPGSRTAGVGRAQRWSLGAAALCAGALLFPAEAGALPPNVSENQPVRVGDATPVAAGERQLRVRGQAQLDSGQPGDRRLILTPLIRVGFAPRWELEVATSLRSPNGDRTRLAETELSLMRNVVAETARRPAVAVTGAVTLPVGGGRRGLDTSLLLSAEKGIGPQQPSAERISVNIAWMHNAQARADEQQNGYFFGLAYARALDARNVAVGALSSDQDLYERQRDLLFEVALIRVMSPRTQVFVAGALGLDRHSPDGRLSAGLQHIIDW